MLVFREIKPDLLQSSSLALGMFDGVHLGHQKVILNAIKESREFNNLSAVVTFTVHPQTVMTGQQVKLITTLDDKLDILEELGVQAVILLDFNDILAGMPAKDYLVDFLIKGLNAKSITVGYNHQFGLKKEGDCKLLEYYRSEYDYRVSVISPVTFDGQIVSSSLIRDCISSGDVFSASKYLGRPFSIKNKVIYGKQRGRVLGFPTANLAIPPAMIAPKTGVYSGMVDIEGKSYYAVVNVGKRPTFGDLTEDLVEAHILDFEGDLYNQEIEVNFLQRIRDEKKFSSQDELKQQIQADCSMVVCSPTLQ